MNEELIFQQMNFIRQITLYEMKHLLEDQADQMPQGFSNTIRWNLGHIYTFQNMLLSQYGGKNIELPDGYTELFAPKTKPVDWPSEVPTLAELKQLLEQQPAIIQEALAGHLNETALKPFKSISTIGELLIFSMYHEGMHIGTIKALKKATVVLK